MAVRLLILFIVLPIVELWLLIKVGSIIGALPTIALVILTAIIGSQLVRHQGLMVLRRVRETQARNEPPALALLDGAALLFAGFLLIMPGFITDTLGFLLLVPKLRERIARALLARVVILSPAGAGSRYAGRGQGRRRRDNPNVIEGEYRRKDRSDEHGDDRDDT
jgi:UPF0716 protein FxsA